MMARSQDSDTVIASIQAKIVELEEMLEGKQVAIDSLLEENEELRSRQLVRIWFLCFVLQSFILNVGWLLEIKGGNVYIVVIFTRFYLYLWMTVEFTERRNLET